MIIKQGFRVRQIANSYLAVPTGRLMKDVPGVVSLSESGALLWNMLSTGCELDDMVTAVLKEYDIDEITARNDVNTFIDNLREKGWLDE